jgi:hypothetical protein
MNSRRFVVGCLVALGLLLGLLAGRRALEVWPYPIGTGDSQKSPDGRYEAFITDWHDESFFGNSRQWFEFEVRGGSPQRLSTDPILGPYFGSRSTNTVIVWADDSSVVRFVFPTTEIRMKP